MNNRRHGTQRLKYAASWFYVQDGLRSPYSLPRPQDGWRSLTAGYFSARLFMPPCIRLLCKFLVVLTITVCRTGQTLQVTDKLNSAQNAADSIEKKWGFSAAHLLEARQGRESALAQRMLTLDSGDCVVLDNDFSRMLQGTETVPTEFANTSARYFLFKPRVDSHNFLLIERETVLKQSFEGADSPSPDLQMLSLSGSNTSFANFTCVQVDGRIIDGKRVPSDDVTISDMAVKTGGYAGLYPDSAGSLTVFPLHSDIRMGDKWQPLALHLSLKGATMKFGYHFPLQVLAQGMRFRQTFLLMRVRSGERGSDCFAQVQRVFGLGGSKPAYTVTAEAGTVADISYPLDVVGWDGAVVLSLSQANLPVNLPIRIAHLHDNWTTVLAELPLKETGVPISPGLLQHRALGVKDSIGYATVDLNAGAHRVFLGHPAVCDRPEIGISVVDWNAKGLALQLRNPVARPVTTKLQVNKRLGSGRQIVQIPMQSSVTVHLSWK